jgi:hypothetical protein
MSRLASSPLSRQLGGMKWFKKALPRHPKVSGEIKLDERTVTWVVLGLNFGPSTFTTLIPVFPPILIHLYHGPFNLFDAFPLPPSLSSTLLHWFTLTGQRAFDLAHRLHQCLPTRLHLEMTLGHYSGWYVSLCCVIVLVIGPGVYERDSATLSAGFRSWFSYGYYLLYIRWTI